MHVSEKYKSQLLCEADEKQRAEQKKEQGDLNAF
jgi:hypothetical protein